MSPCYLHAPSRHRPPPLVHRSQWALLQGAASGIGTCRNRPDFHPDFSGFSGHRSKKVQNMLQNLEFWGCLSWGWLSWDEFETSRKECWFQTLILNDIDIFGNCDFAECNGSQWMCWALDEGLQGFPSKVNWVFPGVSRNLSWPCLTPL